MPTNTLKASSVLAQSATAPNKRRPVGIKLVKSIQHDQKSKLILAEFERDESKMIAEIEKLKKQTLEAEQNAGERLQEKTQTLKTNIIYYGGRTQELIEAIVQRRPYDPDTGLRNTLTNTVKSLGIDTESIKFNQETGEFDSF